MNSLLEQTRGADRNRPSLHDRLSIVGSGIVEAETLLTCGKTKDAFDLLKTVRKAVESMMNEAKP